MATKTKFRAYPRKHYTVAQRAWCILYETETLFEPMMGDYEAGNMSFEEAQEWNKQWLLDWVRDTVRFL